MQTIEWLDMRMEVPEDWEIVRHSVRRRQGRLVLVDRRQQRMQVSWVDVAKRPDLERVISDYKARDKAEDAKTTFRGISCQGNWRGFRRIRGETALTRVGWHHEKSGRWIELSIFWPTGVEEALETGILKGFEPSGSEEKTTRVQAFGIALETDQGWTLSEAEVKPAAVKLTLRRGAEEATVRRLGMVESWFKGDLEGFLKHEMGGEETDLRKVIWNGHEAHRGEGRLKGSWMSGVLGLRGKRSDLAWVCPQVHSLFQVTIAGRGSERTAPEAMNVRCCGNAAGGVR